MVTNIMDTILRGGTNSEVFVLIVNLILCMYPIIGAVFWFWGGIAYHLFRKQEELTDEEIAQVEHAFITIMVPAHNEELMIESTVRYLLDDLNYDNYEVLVVDDGSSDQTPQILKKLQKEYPKLRVLRIDDNQGKAHAFNVGMLFARGEYILSNDADTIPEKDALLKYMTYFSRPEAVNYSAITANMDVANRSSLLGKSQTVEFSSIVGIIKRSQTAVNNTMYAYSGANTMYRKRFLVDAGGFRQDRATEDISIAWDHTFMNVIPKFAPDIVFYMNVPESFGDLYKQRKRWAQGGTEVWLSILPKIIRHPFKNRFVFSMILDMTFSIIWSIFLAISTIFFVVLMSYFLMTGNYERVFHGIVMSMIFVTFQVLAGFMQVLAALVSDLHAVKLKYLFFAPIYLMFTWIVNPLTIITTFIPAVKTALGYGKGTWKSPKRISRE